MIKNLKVLQVIFLIAVALPLVHAESMPKLTTAQWLEQADKELTDASAILKPGAKLLTQVQINKGVQALKKTEYSLKQAEKEANKLTGPTKEQKDARLLLKQTTNKATSAREKITKAGTMGLVNKQKKHKEGFSDLQSAQEMLKKVRNVFK